MHLRAEMRPERKMARPRLRLDKLISTCTEWRKSAVYDRRLPVLVIPANERARKSFSLKVIPGRSEGPSPEPKNTVFPICSQSGVHGFRTRGQRPRPGMTAFRYLFTRSQAGTRVSHRHRRSLSSGRPKAARVGRCDNARGTPRRRYAAGCGGAGIGRTAKSRPMLEKGRFAAGAID